MAIVSVIEIEKNPPRPNINDDCLKIFDSKHQKLYLYGGSRWKFDENPRSPCREETCDFFCLDLVNKKWLNCTNSTSYCPQEIVPFTELDNVVEPDPLPPGSKTVSLPLLVGACGTIVHDDRTHKTYMLIFGWSPNLLRMRLIYVNLDLKHWKEIYLTGPSPERRLYGSMTVTGLGTKNMFLSIFGGMASSPNNNSMAYSTTFTVICLISSTVVKPCAIVPTELGIFGTRFSVLPIVNVTSGDKVIIFRGQVEYEGKAQLPSFNDIAIFDPSSLQFGRIAVDIPFPPSRNTYSLHPIVSTMDSFVFIGFKTKKEHDNSEVDRIWPEVRRKDTSRYQIWTLLVTEKNSEKLPSISCSRTLATARDISVLHQKGRRSSQFPGRPKHRKFPLAGTMSVALSNSFQVHWEELSNGHQGDLLNRLDDRFSVECACLQNSRYFNHARDMNILLLGFHPNFAGDKRVRSFNACFSINLTTTKDGDDEPDGEIEVAMDSEPESTVSSDISNDSSMTIAVIFGRRVLSPELDVNNSIKSQRTFVKRNGSDVFMGAGEDNYNNSSPLLSRLKAVKYCMSDELERSPDISAVSRSDITLNLQSDGVMQDMQDLDGMIDYSPHARFYPEQTFETTGEEMNLE